MLLINQNNLDVGITKLQDFLRKKEVLYLDTETTGVDFLVDNLLLLVIGDKDSQIVFNFADLSDKIKVYILQLIQDSKILVVGHNLNFDVKFLYKATGVMLTNVYDTFLVEVLIDTDPSHSRYPSLELLVQKYCGIQLNKSIRETFIGYDKKTFSQEQLQYACEDIYYLPTIKEALDAELVRQKQTKVADLENRLLPVVAHMEYTGILVDVEKLKQLSDVAQASADEIRLQMLEIVKKLSLPEVERMLESLPAEVQRRGKRAEDKTEFLLQEINFLSPKQSKVFLSILGLEVESTGQKVLESITSCPERPAEYIKLLLSYREYKKLVSTYGEGLISEVHPVSKRIHSNFSQLGTRTGRFSSSKPNLQNIPRDSRYREPFIAAEGNIIIDADYAQEEYRLAGAICSEPAIIQAYLSGLDMHTQTAANVFGVSVKEVTKEQRNHAKGYNFGILYGASANGLAYALGCEKTEAKKIIDKFYSGYPVLAKFKTAFENKVIERGYSTTVLGRKRFFERKFNFKSDEEAYLYYRTLRKEGFNHLIQGTGADILKQALCNIYYNNPYGDDLKIVGTVHDEILVEVKEGMLEQARDFVIEQMKKAEQTYLGEIPAVVEVEIGNCWKH